MILGRNRIYERKSLIILFGDCSFLDSKFYVYKLLYFAFTITSIADSGSVTPGEALILDHKNFFRRYFNCIYSQN